MTGISYYPLRISPTKKVWAIDKLISGRDKNGDPIRNEDGQYLGLPIRGYDKRTGAPHGLATIFPPVEMRHVKANARARRRLRRDGSVKSQETQKKPVAVIPGYVYVGFADWDDYHRLMRFEERTGALKLIGLQWGNPYALLSEDVSRLQLLAAVGGKAAQTVIHHSIKPGDKVRLTDGPFAQMEDVTLRSFDDARGRAKVLVQMFGAMHEVDVPADTVVMA